VPGTPTDLKRSLFQLWIGIRGTLGVSDNAISSRAEWHEGSPSQLVGSLPVLADRGFVIPFDVYLPGCPPSGEDLVMAFCSCSARSRARARSSAELCRDARKQETKFQWHHRSRTQ
jgi:hypothetical protein